MARNIHPDLLERLSKPVVYLAWCWRLTRLDGVKYGFTTLDTPFMIENLLYQCNNSFDPSAISMNNNMEVNNLELSSLFDSNGITENDLLAGKFDFAKLDIFIVDYGYLPTSLTQTPYQYIPLLSGILGEVSNNNQGFIVEARGKTQYLTQKSFRSATSKTCRYKFGDSKCQVGLAPYTTGVTISGKINVNKLTLNINSATKNLTNYQLIINDFKTSIVKHEGLDVTLLNPIYFALTPNQSATVIQACEKTRDACKTFNNIINFGGEPDLPGADKLYAGYQD